jgi:hypothetical protein
LPPSFCSCCYSNTVWSSTSVAKARRARSTKLLRNAFSSSGVNVGFPNGCGIATVGTIRFAPTVLLIGTMVHICTTGNPARSISLTIAAPQRVQVPHVEVRITASTPAARRSSAMLRPYLAALATAVPFPTVA